MTRPSSSGVAVLAAIVIAAGVHAGQVPTKQDSESMVRKIRAVDARAAQPPANGAAPLRTTFSEREVNAFLKYDGKTQLPVGVVDPQITIGENGQLEGRAMVDLDAVRKTQSSVLLDLIAMVTGSVEIRASGRLQAADGKGTLVLDRTTVSGISVPKGVLQSVVTHYSRTPDAPNGFDLDKPFDLPAAIRSVETQRGTAIIVQ
jgi:hypothetical protein